VGVSEDGVNNYGNTLIFTGSTTHKTVSLPGFDSPIYDVLCMVKATAVEYNSNSHFSSPKDAYLPLFWTTERKVVMSAPTFLQPEAGTETLAKMENPRSRTVLCVDDERIGLRVRKIMLESRGYTVLTANSGDEGLKMFDENHVDVVVLDYFMPGLNGGGSPQKCDAVGLAFRSCFCRLISRFLLRRSSWRTPSSPRATHRMCSSKSYSGWYKLSGILLRSRKGHANVSLLPF